MRAPSCEGALGAPQAPSWRDLRELLRPVRPALLWVAALQAVVALASLVPFVCVVEIGRRLLDAPTDEGPIHVLVAVAAGAFALRLIGQGIGSQITHLADNSFQLAVRRLVAAKLGRLPLGWFGSRHSGQVKRAVQDDVNAMHYLVAHSLPDLVSGTVAPLAAFAYLAWLDWRLSLIALAPLALFAALYLGIVRGYSAQMSGFSAALGRVDAAVVELMHGIEVVKAFGRAGGAHAPFARSAERLIDFHDEWVRPIARRAALAEMLVSAPAMLLAILSGGLALVAWGGMEPLDVIAFALLGLGLTQPLTTLGHSAQGFRLAAEAASRVAGLLGEPELVQASRGPGPATQLDVAGVELSEVGFSYDGRTEVLSEVSATLAPGTVTALVGASGAGKSTLAGLIPRFWDVSAGAVRVDGADVRDLPADDLYRRVAFVFQEAGLLRASVRDNIALGRADAGDEQVAQAARAARIHERALALPRGYDSVVGVDARLSGGEAQRVAIARAILADRPILVLDEATAFADPESESAIQEALSRLAAGRTVVVIAHRLSTIVGADRILVVSDGRVIERGRHEELLARDGAYARMWSAHERAVVTAR